MCESPEAAHALARVEAAKSMNTVEASALLSARGLERVCALAESVRDAGTASDVAHALALVQRIPTYGRLVERAAP
jgi:uncharacterized membrane protein YqiK